MYNIENEARKLVDTFSIDGLEDLVNNTKTRIKEIEKEMDSIGENWTPSKIAGWYLEHGKMIEDETKQLALFSIALMYAHDRKNVNDDDIYVPGHIVKHFKGELYLILGVSRHSETGEKLITYRSLYNEFKCWTQPYEMFVGEVDHEKYPNVKQKYRFEIIK